MKINYPFKKYKPRSKEGQGENKTPHRHLQNRLSKATESGEKTKQKRPEKKEKGKHPDFEERASPVQRKETNRNT